MQNSDICNIKKRIFLKWILFNKPTLLLLVPPNLMFLILILEAYNQPTIFKAKFKKSGGMLSTFMFTVKEILKRFQLPRYTTFLNYLQNQIVA